MKRSREKWNIYKVKKLFIEEDCKCLEDEYINARHKMKYICSCGRESSISLDNFKKGKRCWDCGIVQRSLKRTKSWDEVFNYFKENNCLLLDSKYINASSPLNYICTCGRKSVTTYNRFQSGGRCRYCGIKKATESIKLSYEFVKSVFIDNGCVLLEESYINQSTPMRYICKCGRKSIISFSAFHYGNQRCWQCGIDAKSGANCHLWKGGITELHIYARSLLGDWKERTLREYNYKCTIKNTKNNLVIHHLYPFHKILKESAESVNLKIMTIKDYTRDEINLFETEFLKTHERYGLGVVLERELHNLFHHMYGQTKFTIDDFYHFVDYIKAKDVEKF